MAEHLSQPQSILLAVHFASESQIQPLQQLFLQKTPALLHRDLVLRILLTFLPEVAPPDQYVDLVRLVATNETGSALSNGSPVDTSFVDSISDATADKRLRRLSLLPLSPPTYPSDAPDDLLTRFLCHRAYRIDQETGLVASIPDLITPFLAHSDYLRLWYASVVLPLLRLQHELYPALDPDPQISLEAFESIDGHHGTELLLSGPGREQGRDPEESGGLLARDLRCIVGPWLYGHTNRKRRRLTRPTADEYDADPAERGWEHVNTWLVRSAVDRFSVVVAALEGWAGPTGLDLGPVEAEEPLFEGAHDLERRYIQAMFAACYAVEDDTAAAVASAHGVLVRIAELMDFEPPPDLATSVDQLPRIEDHVEPITNGDSQVVLDADKLLQQDHPLTVPSLPSFMLLQTLVYSAYQLAGLGHNVSICNVTKLRFFSTADEQMALVRKILHELSANGRRNEHEWLADRGRLLWLWDWNIEERPGAVRGTGIFGLIPRSDLDRGIITSMLVTGNFALVDRLYLQGSDTGHKLTEQALEDTILAEAMRCYDNASNGNKNRGNMKKAFEILTAFRLSFPSSKAFERALALITATHSMSFYSLTLQHGVPFQPVNIRAAQDPPSLLEQILEQNAKSYAKLDDLLSIGRNLAVADPSQAHPSDPPDHKSIIKQAERRVVFMCISSALSSGDFDTAYSYLINRLAPSSRSPSQAQQEEQDDTSWRAAFLAGRHRSPPAHPVPQAERLRRLEQRAELLSLALLLAPPPALTDILNVYRRCEEETAAALLERDSARDVEDLSGPSTVGPLPGQFDAADDGRVYGQVRREVGRLGAGQDRRVVGAASMDEQVGLFDLARGAAGALRRNAFPLSGGGAGAAARRTRRGEVEGEGHGEEEWGAAWAEGEEDEDGQGEGEAAWGWTDGDGVEDDTTRTSAERVRKRDMLADAVTGSLASGIGWVLGATPANASAAEGRR